MKARIVNSTCVDCLFDGLAFHWYFLIFGVVELFENPLFVSLKNEKDELHWVKFQVDVLSLPVFRFEVKKL